VVSTKSKKSATRSFILTPKKFKQLKERFEETTVDVPLGIKKKAGNYFFNPFRLGIYFAQVQALYLLSCNEYHPYAIVEKKIEEILKNIEVLSGFNIGKNKWQVLCSKCDQIDKKLCKDERGKIQHNFFLMQRTGKNSPYAYKLAQVHSCIDIIEGMNMLFEYRLNTRFNNIKDVSPFYTNRRKNKQRHNYVNFVKASKVDR